MPDNTAQLWESIYRGGQDSRYPYDMVVSFVFQHAPRAVPRTATHVLEVGFGSGNNLWFAAREGFAVSGVEVSTTAVEQARARFVGEGLEGDLRLASATALPFADAYFHLAVDRSSLACLGLSELREALTEVRRVLVPGGRLLFTPYAASHTSALTGLREPDGRTRISAGMLQGVGNLLFLDEAELRGLLAPGWRLLSLKLMETSEKIGGEGMHSYWAAVAEKTP